LETRVSSRENDKRPAEASSAAIDDPRVAAAMQEYLDALDAGRTPPREAFLAQHAEIAAELAGCLEGLDLVHEAALVIRHSEDPPAALSPEELNQPLGDFRIIREIGRGGMGVVYEAVQLSLGRRVALKVLPLAAALDPKHLQRFKNEAQAAAQLHHTNIVPVYAVGSERGVHYYSMQLIDGYSLADLIDHRRQLLGKSMNLPGDRPGNQPTEKATPATPAIPQPPRPDDRTEAFVPQPPPVADSRVAVGREADPLRGCPDGAPGLPFGHPQPPNAALETAVRGSTHKTASERNSAAYFRTIAGLIRQAALALEHAHQLGVVHRDVKPANLLLDERGHLWITDFGLALFHANLQLTRTGDMLGTMRYMSPEQTSGDRVVLDHRTDIYSLGVTLYELLTLEPVVAGAEPHSVLRRIMEEEPRPPRAIDKHIPIELETIVLKAIAKSPAERYATAAAMADDLQRWLDDKPIQARRPTLAEHAARWSRRHWPLIAATAGILALATLGLLLFSIILATEHAGTVAAYKSEAQHRIAADKQRLAADEQRLVAEREKRAADESFRQARQAVDTFLGLSEEELANKPIFHQVRRKFLQAALDYYNEFLDQRRNDPAVRQELLESTQWVAEIVAELAALDRFATFMLLANRYVQEDIGLSADQREKLLGVLTLSADAGQRVDRNQPPLDIEGGQLSEQVNQLTENVEAVLTAKQLARLSQISLQQRGPFAFKSPEIIKTLALTADQRKTINAIIEEESPERRDRRGPGPRGMPGKKGEFEGPPGFGPGPPPPHEGEHGPPGKKGGPRDFGGPFDKGPGGPTRGEKGGPRGEKGGPGRPPPGGEFFDDHSPGGPPPRGGQGVVDFG
jgi:serine/threonine protein kinase